MQWGEGRGLVGFWSFGLTSMENDGQGGGEQQKRFQSVWPCAGEKARAPVFGQGSPPCILFHAQRPKPYASAKHSRVKSLVTFNFSCWGYSWSCAYLQLLMRNVAVAQMTLGRRADALAWDLGPLPFEPLKKQHVRDAEKRKDTMEKEREIHGSRGRVQWPEMAVC